VQQAQLVQQVLSPDQQEQQAQLVQQVRKVFKV
jgi:hypothetical protein